MERRPTPPRQRPCPPPLIRDNRGRCVPPPRVNFLSPTPNNPGAPLGGPAGGLWPSGGSQPQPPAPVPCLPADILADCFAACVGVISQGSPGPVCGWTYFTGISGPPGTVTFTPGAMTFDCPTSNENPGASKPISMTGVNDRTVQFTFQEFNDLLIGSSYVINVQDAGNTNLISINFETNGSVLISVGPQAGVDVYQGTWTPNAGRHEVHLVIDNAGVPRLWLDGTELPLALLGNFPFGGSLPADSVVVSFSDLNNDGIPRTAVLESLFISSGQIPLTRTFCCP